MDEDGSRRDTTSEEMLFGREDADSGEHSVGLLPMSPKRRATSQDAVVIEDDAVDDPVIPPIVILTPPAEDLLPTSISSSGGKRLSLTPGEKAEVLAEANLEGMPPSIVSLPNPTPLVTSGGLVAGPLSPRRRGSGSSRPFEEHSAVWTGDGDDEEEENGVPESRSTEAFEVGGELHVNPSPDSERNSAAVSQPNASDMGLHTPAHVPPAPPDQAPSPPPKPIQDSLGAEVVHGGRGTSRVEEMSGEGGEAVSNLTTTGGKDGLGVSLGGEGGCLGVDGSPVEVTAGVEDDGEGENGLAKGTVDLSSTQKSEHSINEQNALLSGLVVGNADPIPETVAMSDERVTLKEEMEPIDKSRSVIVAVAEDDDRKGEGGRE